MFKIKQNIMKLKLTEERKRLLEVVALFLSLPAITGLLLIVFELIK